MAERLTPASTSSLARQGAWWLVLAGVLLAHVLVTDRIADSIADWNRPNPAPPRIQVAFVRELQAAAPPVVEPAAPAPRPRPRPRPKPAAPAQAAASAPPADTAAAPQAAVPPEAASLPQEPASAVALPDTGVAEPVAAAPPQPEATLPPVDPTVQAARERFEWPPSTRLAYHLSGNYRGPVEGTAQVEWIHVGGRYQVHLDVVIGPGFAPLVSRRMSSEGVTGPDGLAPQRYDEVTEVAFRAPRRATVQFEPDRIVLHDKPPRPHEAGVQDTASQFVQLTWMFTTQPALLAPGTVVEFPLALPRRVERWTYAVEDLQTVYTAIGPIETVHITPRRPPGAGGDLTAEIWVAPTLQYLPVRIRLRQDAETFVDLMLARAPLQSAELPGGPPPPVPRAPYSPSDPTKDSR